MRNTKIDSETTMAPEVSLGLSLTGTLFDDELGRMGTYFLQRANHSQFRSQQRGISNEIITLAIEYGKVFHMQGLTVHVLGDKGLPMWMSNELQQKIENTVVVIANESQINRF